MKQLVKRVLRIVLFPVLRYFGPRFQNVQARLDDLSARIDSLTGTLNARLDQLESRVAADVETTMELLATAQRSPQPAAVAPSPAAPEPPAASRQPAARGSARVAESLERLQRRLNTQPELSYNKVCNLSDFAHPELAGVLREVFAHELERFGPDFPVGFEYRKHWEVAMAVRALTDLGAVSPESEILGVGAGNEPTIFYLTSRVHRLFATDIYLEPGVWKEFADSSMLLDPGRHWPFEWNPRRLVAQHMSAMELLYEDSSFDGIFSSSSVEHFGELKDVERAMDEMWRVLKPGGILSLSTEYRIEGDTRGVEGCLMFDRDDLFEYLIGDRDWELVSPLDTAVSPETLAAQSFQDDLMQDFEGAMEEGGSVVYHELEFKQWPQILLRKGPLLWTSAHLALRKASS